MNHQTQNSTSTAGTVVAILAGAGAIAMAAATASDGTLFIVPNWLLILCTVAVVAASLYLAQALRVTRLAMLLTGLGALGMAISAGGLCQKNCASKCSRTAAPADHSLSDYPAPARAAWEAVAGAFVIKSVSPDWTDNAERAANLAAHPESVADARRDAERDIREGHLRLHVPDYHEVWQEALVEELTAQGIRMDYVSSCGMSSDSVLAYMRAYNDAMREALGGFYNQPGYVSWLSRALHTTQGNGNSYHPYVL